MADSGLTREEAERIAAPEMERYRQQIERDDPLGFVQAIRHAIMWSLPVPDWATEHALKAVEFYYLNHGGAPGRGKTGSLRSQVKWNQIHRRRHHVAERELALLKHGIKHGSKGDAFQRASDSLIGDPAWAQPRELKRSYAKVEAILKQNSDH